MDKVIVERPRWGGGLHFPRSSDRGFDRVAVEDRPRREGMRRPWLWNGRHKELNENLAPLRRFLRSNVGRPWDKVFAEICEHLNFDSAVQLHIWQHIRWEVCMHPVREGRRWVNVRGYPLWERFLVDPKTGILRENKDRRKWRREKETPSPNFIAVEAGKCYRRLEGIWYEFTLAPIPSETAGLVDVALKRKLRDIHRQELIKFHGGEVYAVKKRQLNSKEIRRLPKLS